MKYIYVTASFLIRVLSTAKARMSTREGAIKGFTLIELMIVLVILALLALVAIPGYQSQVRDARRSNAQADLLKARQAMERHFSKSYSYAGAAAGTTFPDQSPSEGGDSYYTMNLAVSGVGATYVVTAAATGSQANDDCGDLSIDHAGRKGAKGNAPDSTSMADVEECW